MEQIGVKEPILRRMLWVKWTDGLRRFLLESGRVLDGGLWAKYLDIARNPVSIDTA